MSLNNVSNQNKQVTNSPVKPKNKQNKPSSAPAQHGFTAPASVVNTTNTVDRAEIHRLVRESQDQTRVFEQLISSMMGKQARNFRTAWSMNSMTGELREMFENINVSDADRARAQELVSEDGFFGVSQTSERILNFARAYAGTDPARIERMRAAFQRGFRAAELAWGGELPDISRKTYEAVMAGFDAMLRPSQEDSE